MAHRSLAVLFVLFSCATSVLAQSAPTEGGYRLWVDAEYLLWQVQDAPLPVLGGAITAVEAETSRRLAPGTIQPLIGGPGRGISYCPQSGGRVNLGYWLDDEGFLGLEASYFQLGEAGLTYSLRSNGDPAIGPVFRDRSIDQDVLVMSSIPGLRAGTLTVSTANLFRGADVAARHRLEEWFGLRVEILGGARFLQFDERLDAIGTSIAIPNGRLPCG